MDQKAYQAFFDASPNPMWVFDESTLRFLEVNQAASRVYGYSREEFLQMTIADIRPPSEVPAMIDSLRAGGELGENVWTHLRRDGQEMLVSIFSTPTEFSGRPVRAVTVRDVTFQIQAAQELASANLALRTILAASPACILSVDAEGRIETWNPAAEALMDIGLDAARGQHVWSVFGVDEGMVTDALSRVKAGEDVEGFHLTVKRGEEQRHLLLSAAPLFGPDGQFCGAMAVILDHSNSFKAHLDLEAWSELLERRVADRTSELVAANAELEGFCASVSHDLRSPLRAIDGFSRAILEDYGEVLDDQGRDFLQRVRAASWRMSALIDDLLGLTRLTRATLSRSLVDLSRVARETLNEVRFRDNAREFYFDCPDSVMVYGDQRLLKMLLTALLENAWKFTAGVPNPGATFLVHTSGTETVYEIRDNGVGFDMTYVDKLFRPFERLHSATEFPGNGIGLATASRIVARHGGRIWAESTLGQGTSIRFTLDSPSSG